MNMPQIQPFKPEQLNDSGLNLQFVINIDDLPSSIKEQLGRQVDPLHRYRQLVLIGHGGKTLWRALAESRGAAKEDPIDHFTVDVISNWLNRFHANIHSQVIYPTSKDIDLITLGELAGWHHDSPFKSGINNIWGPWFAYRAVILADSHFAITPPQKAPSPCTTCSEKICISSCPAEACSEQGLDINKCIRYRRTPNSKCAKTCLARISCPVQVQHQYTETQLDFHYTESMKIINQFDL